MFFPLSLSPFPSPAACNVLVQETAAVYKMSNFGHARNCTLSALFPAAISLANLRIGSKSVRAQEKVNYDVSMGTSMGKGQESERVYSNRFAVPSA